MGLKATPTATPETAQKEPKVGKGMRNQFWSTGSVKSESKDEQTLKRPDSTVSRQFLPKKQQGISEAWSKQVQESREDPKQPFPYTPFKSGSLSKAPSINALRGATPNPQFNQEVSQIYGVQQQPGYPRTVSSGQDTMRAHYNAHSLYGTSAIPRPEPKGIWRGPQSGVIPPPPGPYRPASAMNAAAVTRPTSRANSDLGIGTVGLSDAIGGIPSRYQSYCTLPRPEQIDFDQHSNYGSEISQMAKQISQLYGSYNMQNQLSMNPNPVPKQGVSASSRPASSMLAGAPGMASDYITRQHSVYGPGESNVVPQTSDEEILKPAKDIVSFDAVSLLSVFQVLCSLVIFGCGVLRIMWNSKWAIGLELAFAVLVFTTGITGIYANSRRSHSAATATFILSMVNFALAVIPFMLGLFPAIVNAFPTVDPEWLLNADESLVIDYLLSFSCFAEIVIAMITSIYGCKSFGSTMKHVEKLRLNADLNAAFEGSSETTQKQSDGMDKKGAM